MEIKDLNAYLLSLQNLLNGVNANKNSAGFADDFEKYLKEVNANFDDAKAVNSADIDKFKRNLTNLGAAGFINQLNQAKIEEKIAAKKEELMKVLGLDEEGIASKSGGEILELRAVLDELLAQFKKELLASMQNNSLLEKQQKLSANQTPSSPLSSILGIL